MGAEPTGAAATAGSPAQLGTPDFGALFAQSFRALWLIAYGVVQNGTQAEDVVQEAAVVALSKIRDYRPGTNFTAWMGRIVQYVALNNARAARRRRTSSLDSAEQATSAAPAAPNTVSWASHGQLPADQQMFDDRVMAALNQVSETARVCLLLRTIEELEYSEIARLLRIPEGTAMSHVHRARQVLRQKLADLEPRPPAGKEGHA